MPIPNIEDVARKPLTLTCLCGAEAKRSLPYGLNPVDWCDECGMLFGNGNMPPRYMPGYPLSGAPPRPILTKEKNDGK